MIVALLTAVILLLVLVKEANGNFVYWTNDGGTTIGRAKLNGTGVNNSFVAGLNDPNGIAVDSKFIYWSQGTGADSSIGRANLDGTGANPNFIPNSAGVSSPAGVAVTTTGVYWSNGVTIGHANLDGSNPVANSIPVSGNACGVATDQTFVYWLDASIGQRIGRAGLDGSGANQAFIGGVSPSCGIAVDSNFVYWAAGSSAIGRAPVGGGTANNSFIPSAASAIASGVAVNPQFIFWGNLGPPAFVGRADLNGSSPNPSLVAGPSNPRLLAAAPSNKVTINSITKKKKKGTAIINAKVPGPGQVTIANTGPITEAGAAAVKQIGLTLTAASSFKLAVKPKGQTAKKLKKKGKAGVKVFVTFTPAGVAGVANSEVVKTKLIKQRKKKKR